MIFGINITCNISKLYNNFEISLVVFITTNHAITYTSTVGKSLFSGNYFQLDNPWLIKDSSVSKLSLPKLLYYEPFSKIICPKYGNFRAMVFTSIIRTCLADSWLCLFGFRINEV